LVISGDARETGLDHLPVPTVYWCAPHASPALSSSSNSQRSQTMAETIRHQIHDVDPQRSVYNFAPRQRFSDALAENRLRTILLTFFAVRLFPGLHRLVRNAQLQCQRPPTRSRPAPCPRRSAQSNRHAIPLARSRRVHRRLPRRLGLGNASTVFLPACFTASPLRTSTLSSSYSPGPWLSRQPASFVPAIRAAADGTHASCCARITAQPAIA